MIFGLLRLISSADFLSLKEKLFFSILIFEILISSFAIANLSNEILLLSEFISIELLLSIYSIFGFDIIKLLTVISEPATFTLETFVLNFLVLIRILLILSVKTKSEFVCFKFVNNIFQGFEGVEIVLSFVTTSFSVVEDLNKFAKFTPLLSMISFVYKSLI